jgi:drug/metabolite transporter (DMT)-like permease
MTSARGSPYLPLSIAVLFISIGSILVRLAQAPPLAIAFHRIFIASLALAPFAAGAAARSWPRLAPRQRWLLLGAGVTLAIHFATWIASLAHTTVAASVLLVNTAPLFTLGFSRVLLGEPPPRVVVTATALALVGAILIAADGWTAGGTSLYGDGLAIAGAATLSLYHVAGRAFRAALPLSAYVFGVWLSAAAALALFAWGAGVRLWPYGGRTLAALVLLALVPTLAGHGLVNRSLRALPAPTIGLFLLGEPVAAALLAFAILGERPGPWTLAGGGFVLIALAMVVVSERA